MGLLFCNRQQLSIAALLLSISTFSFAMQKGEPLWLQESASQITTATTEYQVTSGYSVPMHPNGLSRLLANKQPNFDILIPLPDGNQRVFTLSKTQVMAPSLADKYPDIRSFIGIDKGNPANSGRFDLSPDGFSGMFKYNGEWVILTFDKRSEQPQYISYFSKHEIIDAQARTQNKPDYLSLADQFRQADPAVYQAKTAARPNGDAVTTYRIAISAAAEYTSENGGEASALAEIVRLLNRINQVLLSDLAIQFELVANNDRLIFTDAETDPFINDASEDLDANQRTIDQLVGSSNYDIGHLLNTDPGGLAAIDSICNTRFKARGQSGSSRPFGEKFYIQLVIHELGHQLGANHTFNASNSGSCTDDQRSSVSAVEPGSGSTIMSYAGICAKQNLQDDADGYFHNFSIEEIRDNLNRRNCGETTNQGNSIPNISTATIRHVIPANTPFMLTADATDTDNDPLTYTWDQINSGSDLGATESNVEMSMDNGANPLFRSYSPTDSATRYFPNLQDVLNGTLSFGEVYPTTKRQLNFELLVRDGKGGVNTLQAFIDVEPSDDAFAFNTPQPKVRWKGGQLQSVSWNVAATDLAPINCSEVDILLDADGDSVFESTMLANTPNDGEQEVLVPSTNTSRARLKMQCSDNIFYAVNPGSFSILPGDNPVAPLIINQVASEIDEDMSVTIGFSELIVDDPDSSYPSNFTLTVLPGANYSANGNTITPSSNFFGILRVNLQVNDGINDSNIFAFSVQVLPVNDPPLAVDDDVSIVQGNGTFTFDALRNDIDVDFDDFTLVEITYLGNAQVNIVNGLIQYTAANSFFGTDTITYRIQDPSFATDTGTINIQVSPRDTTPAPTPAPPGPSDSGGSLGVFLLCLALLRLCRVAWLEGQ